MADTSDLIQVILNVEFQGAAPDELDVESRRLRRELREAGFIVVDAHEPAPAGSKSPEAFTLGALAVALLPKVIPQLIQVLRGWLDNRGSRRLRLKLPNGVECELTGSMSTAEVNELIDKLLSKQTKAMAARK